MQAQTMVFHVTSNDILLEGMFVYSLRITLDLQEEIAYY
jgi:hypothetical protein